MENVRGFFKTSHIDVSSILLEDDIKKPYQLILDSETESPDKLYTNREMVNAFSMMILEFRIKNWLSLVGNKMTKEEEKQYEEIFFHFGFKVDSEKKVEVVLVHGLKEAERDIKKLDLNLKPFVEKHKMESLFATEEEKTQIKMRACFEFFEKMALLEKIQNELYVRLPFELRESLKGDV